MHPRCSALLGFCVGLICGGLLLNQIGTHRYTRTEAFEVPEAPLEPKEPLEVRCPDVAFFVDERNRVSRALNVLAQDFAQAECKILAPDPTILRHNPHGAVTTSRGGWCYVENGGKTTQHRVDKGLATGMTTIMTGKNVASFGDGDGSYRKFMTTVKEYISYDGAAQPELLKASPDVDMRFLELGVQQYGLPIYDWIVSIKVGEHIPKEYEEIYLSNIFRHAGIGAVVSWAPKGQHGYGHVNLRGKDYLEEKFAAGGFALNHNLTKYLSSSSDEKRVKQNVQVYLRVASIDPNMA